MSANERIKELARKYLDRKLEADEAEELFKWLDNARDPANADPVFREEWEKGGRSHTIDEVTWDQIQQLSNPDQSKNRRRHRIRSLVRWAAAAALILAAFSIWWLNSSEPEMMVYETGFGETMPIHLEDGTHVVLNANSRLSWNSDWEKWGNGRVAELDGEAYFEVSHIPDPSSTGKRIAFQVRTADLVVNVLGTAFNVSSRRGQTDVFLEKGSVKLDLMPGKGENNLKTNRPDEDMVYDTVLMNPGELVSFSALSGELHKNDGSPGSDRTDWKEGTLTFKKISFGEVLSSLKDIYGKTFEVEDESLLDRTVNLALPYENWETVRQLIGMPLNVEFIEQENKDVIKIKKRSGK